MIICKEITNFYDKTGVKKADYFQKTGETDEFLI